MTDRLFGEDGALLADAGAPLDGIAAVDAWARTRIDLPGGGLWLDAHVHLGTDRDGHALTAEDLVADMDRAGVAASVCFPPDEPGADGTFAEANARVARAAERFPGRIIPFCRVDPALRADEVIERAAADGAQGLKLHPVAQRFRPEGAPAVAAVAAATARGWPVLIHAGFGARPLAEPIAAVLAAVPRTRLILAHGGRGDARGLAELARSHPGVLFDTSLASLPDLAALPPDRLCFGTDRPYGDHTSALHLVARAARVAGWSDDELDGVMWRNLRTLLG